jgi:uncharacterized membrane protein YphA (DoxX/SURF4 family)
VFEFLNGDRWRGWVTVPIRMILGVGFMVHGLAKWNRGPAAFAELLNHAGVPFPVAGLVALILGGAGPLSIDALRNRRRQRHLRVAA